MQPCRVKRVHEDRDDESKLKIPPFSGIVNVEAYLEWERKIDHVFDCNTFSDDKSETKGKFERYEDMYHYAIKIEEQLREEDEHSKRYTFKSNTFSNSNVCNKVGFVNKSRTKGKFVVAKRMEAESSNTKKNEASKEVKEKSSFI